MKLSGELLRFGVVGSLGFIVDVVVLTILVQCFDGGLLLSRAFSYLSAATTTWFLHRIYTFRENLARTKNHSNSSLALLAQWSQFIVTNGVGASLNYGVYAALILGFTLCRDYPAIGVAAGSMIAMTFNFKISKRFVFTGGYDVDK